ncbi:hypothetical protein [Chelatococcus reniformis]|uniref:Uncharacterized protein n=1 Tax=Chelatococcus reniformis TaxID=1494448 RepID=A0A916U039_9HYPH|nr:hypothetical protein [Chelatococcus reniformis]GGC50461.1 hypothetical protein GCM10010994_07020 [Chelatococcus reniformis]
MNRHGLARPAAARIMAERPPAPTAAAPVPRGRPRRPPARRSSWRSIPYFMLLLLAGLGLLMLYTSRKPGDAAATAAPQPAAGAGRTAAERPAATAAGAEHARSPATTTDADATDEPAAGTWERLADAPAAFTLSALPDDGVTAGLVELPQRDEAVQHSSGGGRDDAVSLGTLEGEPLLRLSIYRPGHEEVPAPSFYIDVARRAGEAGLSVRRLAATADIDTRFGPVAAADVVFGSRQGDRACIVFRRLGAEPMVRISGWLCGAGLKQPTPGELACVLDGVRWALTEEPGLASIFNGKVSRPGCKPAAPATTGAIAATVDDSAPVVAPAAKSPPRKSKRRRHRHR